MARPLAAVSPGCGVATYTSLTNGTGCNIGITGSGNAASVNLTVDSALHPANGHSNGANISLQSLAVVMDSSPMNAALRLIGDPAVVTQPMVLANTARDTQRASRGQEIKPQTDSTQAYTSYNKKDKPLGLTASKNDISPVTAQSINGSAGTLTTTTPVTETMAVSTSEQQSQQHTVGMPPTARQTNGGRLSQDGAPTGCVGGLGARGNNGSLSNGILLPPPTSPAPRPSVKRCASEDWDEANKEDLKRALGNDGRTSESAVSTGNQTTEAMCPIREPSESLLGPTPPQPKKRGRRKKSEILAAEMARRAELGLMIGGNRELRDARMNDVFGGVIDGDVRRAGREKKPYDPWANRKASGRPFVQDGPCFALLDVTSKKFPKCSSCRINDEVSECRFSEFRKLRFVGDLVQVDGFTDSDDAQDSDRRIWMTADLRPNVPDAPSIGPPDSAVPPETEEAHHPTPVQGAAVNRLDEKTAIMVLTNVGDIMCDLVREEAKVKNVSTNGKFCSRVQYFYAAISWFM